MKVRAIKKGEAPKVRAIKKGEAPEKVQRPSKWQKGRYAAMLKNMAKRPAAGLRVEFEDAVRAKRAQSYIGSCRNNPSTTAELREILAGWTTAVRGNVLWIRPK